MYDRDKKELEKERFNNNIIAEEKKVLDQKNE